MYRYNIKTGLIFLLIFSLTFSQFVPDLAHADKKKLEVAFIGIQFKKLPKEIEKMLLSKISKILEQEESIILTKPEGAQKVFGQDKINALLTRQDLQSLSAFAKQNQFDYVFYGTIVNQSSDSNQVFLAGELNRFDLSNNEINRYGVNSELNQFNKELKKFKKQYVMTLSKDSGFKLWPFLVIVGLVFATTMLFKGSNSGGEPGNQKPGPIDE